ncbi:50S ribosomal protein L24 [Candidatus Parcubacteria bacterium]|nr:MAG: 50S ribosomal protein L24 [Candidatus Parcubacteria bacterium]
MSIKKGDQVKVLSGKDRGKTGKVLHVFEDERRLTVEGSNLYKKRVRPKRSGQKGEVVLVSRPFSASKVMLVCDSCKKPTRTGNRFDGDVKVRYCKRCDARIA